MRGAATSIARSPRGGGAPACAPMPFPAARASRNARTAAPTQECGAAIRRLGAKGPQARGRSHS